MKPTSAPHTWPRLFVEAPLKNEAIVTLNAEQTHYLINVMRAEENAPIRLFNGTDGEWIAKLTERPKKKKGQATLSVSSQRRRQDSVPDLWLCAAPIKRAHFDFMVMKATELGVKVIQPILSERTQVRTLKIDRLTSIAIEAAEQSERLTIPTIMEPLSLPKMIEKWDNKRLAIICAEFGDAKPVHEAFADNEAQAATKTALFTGPEGGYTEKEMSLFPSLNKHMPIRLGKRILRADTAAIAAISCWQAQCGDWDEDIGEEKDNG